MRCKGIFILIFGVLFIGIISASFTYSEAGSSITTQYETSDYLNAYLNISFFNEPLSSTFNDSLGNSISLGELLQKDPEYFYLFSDFSNTTVISAFQHLDMGKAGFVMPANMGDFNYRLDLGGTNIFEEPFQILSGGNLVGSKIDEKYSELNASKFKIAQYDPATQSILNDLLNLTSIENTLKELELRYANANTIEEYNEISDELSSLKIPTEIGETVNTNPISFYPDRDNINLEALRDIGGGDFYGNEQGYIDAIYLWNDENVNTYVTFMEIFINYGLNEQTVLRIFQFEFDKTNLNEDAYFIMGNMENLKFEDLPVDMMESNYGYKYAYLNDLPDIITFSTTDNLNFLDVPVFISPSLDSLTPAKVGAFTDFREIRRSKWILFGLIIFLLILIGTITYVMLQIWYRRKYENHLFKNRNNLYNIMTFIQNAKKKGMDKEAILRELKKAKWTREQIKYALNKYEGRKIAGIIERPFKKVIQEIEKKPVNFSNTKVLNLF